MMPTSSPAFSCLARYSPTRRAPLRLSGPTNGTLMFLLLTHGRVELVIDVDHGDTGIDGLLDHRHHGLGVGRRDDQRIDLGQTIICSTMRIWSAVSVSSLMPLEIRSKSAECSFW